MFGFAALGRRRSLSEAELGERGAGGGVGHPSGLLLGERTSCRVQRVACPLHSHFSNGPNGNAPPAQVQEKQQRVAELAQGGGEAGAGAARKQRLMRGRDLLLSKLIGNWQKQTLGRAFAAWLRSIEAFKMDRILSESDKYMSMDSSIDDLLNDALSKRRARSIVASSVSLGGSSIDDDVFQAAALRPGSGGSSFGGSSISGSLEWMV